MPEPYTDYMTTEEVQRALSIAQRIHVHRILLSHMRHTGSYKGLVVLDMEEGVVAYRGEQVKEVAACNECFPILHAARKTDTALTITRMLTVSEE